MPSWKDVLGQRPTSKDMAREAEDLLLLNSRQVSEIEMEERNVSEEKALAQMWILMAAAALLGLALTLQSLIPIYLLH